jgi:predicted unusual protein kinase regulating ubiquinone biosynthesis (AarF/ABC1/UbiB family)
MPPPRDDDAEERKKEEGPRAQRPPTSRLGRLARLTALAPRALPLASAAVKRALVGKSPDAVPTQEEREKVLESAKKTADAMLKTLGEMKGLPLKLGQMASYIDGLAPPGYEERFKETLKKLQAKAPPLSPEAAIKVVTEDLGAPPDEVFATWEREPFAAASIGQVHRATTRGGDRVAVKVQYPGIDKAIENDLKSISMLETMVAPIGRRYHSKEGLEEIKTVFMRELDYTAEAEVADLFRRVHAEDPDIVIPRVHHSLTTRRVLTADLLGGQDYATFCKTASQADKDAAGQTIWRFMMRALFKHAVLYADPHPGNYRFLGGGKVGFLDFGCHKEMPHDLVEGEKRYLLTQIDGDDDAFYRACIDVLGYDPTDEEGFPIYIEYTRLATKPAVVDEPFTYTPEYAREMVAFLVRNTRKIIFKDQSKLPTLPKPIHMPKDHTFVNRLQWGLASVLAGMNATANWHRISMPWLRGPIEPIPD